MNESLPLNLTFLENRMGELGLKSWWVAERIGVDRKTLSRWMTGKVKSIKPENLKSLAQCLECQEEDLILSDSAEVIASKEEQAVAARLIIEDNLLLTLTQGGQWPLLESIVKATMQPDLPLPVMGKLYNLLSVCSWRQDRIEKAKAYAEKAYHIGKQAGHRGVVAQANSNLAVVASFQGRLHESLPLYQAVIAERAFIEEERTIAAALSNLAQDYQTCGDYEKSRKIQEEAIALYSELKLPLTLCIAYCGLGLLELELESYEAAERALLESLRYATTANYVRGTFAAKVYLADVYAQQGDFEKAGAFLRDGLDGFEKQNLREARNNEVKARIARLQGDYETSEAALAEGFTCADQFPLEQASLHLELSQLALTRGDSERAAQAREAALAIYREAGAVLRVARLKGSI